MKTSSSKSDFAEAADRRKSVHIVMPAKREEGHLKRNTPIASKLNNVNAYIKSAADRFRERSRVHSLGQANKTRIKDMILPRYMEFEPLCCLSSALVRVGCYSVVAFECTYVFVVFWMVALKIYDGGRMDIWDELDTWNFNAVVTHQITLYLLCLFNLLSLSMAFILASGLYSFQRNLIKIHWRFDFVALTFNIVMFILHIFALNSEGPETWSWKNVFLVTAFFAQIPLQLWAISVVKSCYDFYVLLYVFVTLTEK